MIPLLPPAYFAPISYFALVINADGEISINKTAWFKKQTIRNRAEILGANGKIKLIVPLIKWSTKVPINEIRVDNSSNWKHVHWMSIQSAYRNSAFFEHYEDQIRSFFDQDHESLVELNAATMELCADLLKIELKLTEEFPAKHFEDQSRLFEKKRLAANMPEYPQVFNDRFNFLPDLSILDLLFNLGPRAIIYLQNTPKIGTP